MYLVDLAERSRNGEYTSRKRVQVQKDSPVMGLAIGSMILILAQNNTGTRNRLFRGAYARQINHERHG